MQHKAKPYRMADLNNGSWQAAVHHGGHCPPEVDSRLYIADIDGLDLDRGVLIEVKKSAQDAARDSRGWPYRALQEAAKRAGLRFECRIGSASDYSEKTLWLWWAHGLTPMAIFNTRPPSLLIDGAMLAGRLRVPYIEVVPPPVADQPQAVTTYRVNGHKWGKLGWHEFYRWADRIKRSRADDAKRNADNGHRTDQR